MYFNPLDKFYKSVIGAVKCDEKITFRVKGNFDSVFLAVHEDGKNSEELRQFARCSDYFELVTSFNKSGLYFYNIKTNRGIIGLNEEYKGELQDSPCDFQLTVFDTDYEVPSWLQGGIIYQIFPDRFYCSGEKNVLPKGKTFHDDKTEKPFYRADEHGEVLNNDFYGGDFKGIEQKLPYLKELGVTAIYLNPIFKAYSNHRYDTGDYLSIDELLGKKEDFISLIKSAESKGIKIILDGVFNHTGADSIYFNKYGNYDSLGAYQSKDSKYRDWFNFTEYPEKYESWWGIKTLPAVNKKSGFVDFISGENGVIEQYTKLGIGGWRLDVVDELPADFVKKIRRAVKKINKDAVIIGEVWEDASNKISYGDRRRYFQGKELDSVMNYPLKNSIIDFVLSGNAKQFSYTVKTLLDHYPNQVINSLMNILSTHDTVRILSALSGINTEGLSKDEKSKIVLTPYQRENAIKRLKISSLLQFTVFGVPSVYYGDEIGMQGFFDPYNRCYFEWNNIDDELLLWYKLLASVRTKYSAFTSGEFNEIYCNGGTYAFSRKDNDSEVFVAVNCGRKDKILNFDGELFDEIEKKSYSGEIILKPEKSVILVKKY